MIDNYNHPNIILVLDIDIFLRIDKFVATDRVTLIWMAPVPEIAEQVQ